MGPPRPGDVMYWSPLERLFSRFQPLEILRQLRPAATERQVSELERQLGFKVPASLADAWREHDGTAAEGPLIEFISTDAVLAERPLMLAWWKNLGGAGDGASLVPFAKPFDLSFLCVDASMTRTDEVWELDIENQYATIVAPSLASWFRSYAEKLAVENGFRFFGEDLVYADSPDLVQILKCDDEECYARPAIDAPCPGIRLIRGITDFDRWTFLGPGDILRCEVARVPRIATRATFVVSAQMRIVALEAALVRWREAGFELPAVTAQMLLRLPWNDSDGAAALLFAEHAPVIRAKWAPVILRDSIAKLQEKLAEWRLPATSLDAGALIKDAETRRRAVDGKDTLYDLIAERAFARVNTSLMHTEDHRRFVRMERPESKLDQVWVLVTPSQEHGLRRYLSFELTRPGPA